MVQRTPKLCERRSQIAIVQTKAGEYFGLVDPTGFLVEEWDNLPEGRTILVQKYEGMCGKQGIEIVLKQSKYRRDALKMYQKNLKIAERQLVETLFNNSTEDDIMANANEIIEIARTGNVKATENALQSAIGQAIKRALWVAEKKDEFMAIPVLQELNEKYNPGGAKAVATTEIKDAKDIKLTKVADLDDRIWQAVLKKANKIGVVIKASGNIAEIKLPKKEADTFVKAVQAVKGITIS